ncbi:DUF1993 domain-containing protein [Robiginitomaculum antarcticum]|uniref:DUF1993 domain-containing protein n=1 Tax=Robiginitomaculum antarcticum TaxID=437507 RepID=UPI00039C8559|nr:DUF1993 domain-containing protein [Robiginitomaculum antarcticum]
MSTLSMSNAVGALPRLLDNLEHILRIGEANAKERGIDPSIFLNARLAPDMHHLIKQVQIASSLTKMAPYRITGMEPPAYEETETTFNDLYVLIAKAKADCMAVPASDLDGKEGRKFVLKMGPRDMDFTGISYLSGFTLPNIHFHITTAYNILRHNGVPLGKADYFGGMT